MPTTKRPTAPSSSATTHPGRYVRQIALQPKKMSVTDAADLLGVGRPALSNFLNGKAALSSDMAARIERAFSIPAQKLHELQAAFDAAEAKTKGVPANTKTYVPPFLNLKAAEIETWAESIAARTRLAVLLRTLVNSTGVGLTEVDFPGNDDAERPGWDGVATAAAGTPWIPEGKSGWEFGCNADPKSKADGDYAKSVKAIPDAERAKMTFVFVTPRRWPGKDKWEAARRAEKHWKDVRVYDVSDLEQWIEQSVAGQTWFAGETDRFSNGARSLDACWRDWATVADPPLSPELLAPAIEEAKLTLTSRLSKPPQEPIVVTADSTDEALGFLSAALGPAGDKLAEYRDRVVVFDKPGVLPKLAAGASNFIAVVTNREVERELGPFAKTIHSIVLYPRNATTADPAIVLQPLNYEAFRKGLEAMGFDRDNVDRLSRESGRSLTVLRRRLATVEAVRTPAWSADPATANQLVPFLFAGAWSSTNKHDQAVLSLLAGGKGYEALEKQLQAFTQFDDAPIWSVAHYRGVISKIDLLFAVGGAITADDLKTYFDVARLVLSEDDPALDLPEKDRWAATIHGKKRDISAALRAGIGETLVLLAVHGDGLFRARLGMKVSAQAVAVVKELLGELSSRTLEAQEDDLTTYAEVAPNEFLGILEDDLKKQDSAALSLMRPMDSGLFGGGPARTGLLWALEGLAWDPACLARTALILARLAEVKIDDNWTNKPIGSLESIFRSWMPQTAANVQQRIETMQLLAKRYPKTAWKIAVMQFGDPHRVGHYSHKPRWRTEAHGYGEPVTNGERWTFERAMVEMVLAWPDQDVETIGDLIQRLDGLSTEHQSQVWRLVKAWALSGASDSDKALVRERIRVTILSRGAERRRGKRSSELGKRAREAYAALKPTDLLNTHEWLFREHWVDDSADELEEEEMDFGKRGERVAAQRTAALEEVLAAEGYKGILSLASKGKAASEIGRLLTVNILTRDQVVELILAADASDGDDENWSRKNIIAGAIWGLGDPAGRENVLRSVQENVAPDRYASILLLAPFASPTWVLVDQLPPEQQEKYWRGATPSPAIEEESVADGVERLLKVNRPRAAFGYAHYAVEKLPPAVLFMLLTQLAASDDEPEGHYQLEQYYIDKAFRALDASNEFSVDQMAGLEFAYLDVLTRSYGARGNRGIPGIESYIAEHPEFLAHVVAWLYKRKDGGEDPADLQVPDAGMKERRASRAYKLLDALEAIPGRNPKTGELEKDRLAAWVAGVRQACAALGRQDVGDLTIGQLLAHAPIGSDGVWPCEPVRDVIEAVQSKTMAGGVTNGLFNSRGVVWRGEGGSQERDLEAKYRAWERALEFSHPFLATEVLKSIADTYAEEANREDAEAGIRRRLPNS